MNLGGMQHRTFSSVRGSDGLSVPVLGLIALGAIPLCVGIAAWTTRPLYLRQTSGVGGAEGEKPALAKDVDGGLEAAMLARLEQVSGRSLFAVPPEPTKEVAKGPKPTTYGGPTLIAMINNAAWFSDGSRLTPEQGGAGGVTAGGLKVIKLSPPWGATVEWQGGEFDVELFKKTDFGALKDTMGKSPASFFAPASNPTVASGAMSPVGTAGPRPGAPLSTSRPDAPAGPGAQGSGGAGGSGGAAAPPPPSQTPHAGSDEVIVIPHPPIGGGEQETPPAPPVQIQPTPAPKDPEPASEPD